MPGLAHLLGGNDDLSGIAERGQHRRAERRAVTDPHDGKIKEVPGRPGLA